MSDGRRLNSPLSHRRLQTYFESTLQEWIKRDRREICSDSEDDINGSHREFTALERQFDSPLPSGKSACRADVVLEIPGESINGFTIRPDVYYAFEIKTSVRDLHSYPTQASDYMSKGYSPVLVAPERLIYCTHPNTQRWRNEDLVVHSSGSFHWLVDYKPPKIESHFEMDDPLKIIKKCPECGYQTRYSNREFVCDDCGWWSVVIN